MRETDRSAISPDSVISGMLPDVGAAERAEALDRIEGIFAGDIVIFLWVAALYDVECLMLWRSDDVYERKRCLN